MSVSSHFVIAVYSPYEVMHSNQLTSARSWNEGTMAHPGEVTSQRLPRQIYLDGRTLEGGGQLVRIALSLSALTGQKVTIDHVRGNRGGKTGLRASHAAAVKLLAEISGSTVDGGRVESQCVTFSPPVHTESISSISGRLVPLSDIAVRPEYNIRLPTPGSVFLIFQALYPYLLHVGSISSAGSIKVSVTGGTNGTSSPSYDYAAQVMVPNFARLGLPRLSITLNSRGWTSGVVQMGSVTFFIHPLLTETGGAVPAPVAFPRINIMDYERGTITRFDITVLAPAQPLGEEESTGKEVTIQTYIERQSRRVLRKAINALNSSVFERAPLSEMHDSDLERDKEELGQDIHIPIAIHTSEPTSHRGRLYILIVAHTSTGFRLGHDILGHRPKNDSAKGAKRGKKQGRHRKGQKPPHTERRQQNTAMEDVDAVIDECVRGIVREIEGPVVDGASTSSAKKRSCLDQYMRDQIVVFEALGRLNTEGDRSEVQEDERHWTLHTQTAQWVCREMLDHS